MEVSTAVLLHEKEVGAVKGGGAAITDQKRLEGVKKRESRN